MCRVELPNSLVGVNNVFHVSHLRKCIWDLEITITPTVLDDLVVEPNMSIVRKQVRIVVKVKKQGSQISQCPMDWR